MNFGRKMMKAGVAAVAAIATLGAGGVVASTAFAGGGGGNQPGTGGDLAAVQFWQYKDDASGAWGPATSLDSVRAAMNNAGVTLEGDGVTKAQAALDQARTECETGFQRRHRGDRAGQVPAGTTDLSLEREHAGCGDVGPVGRHQGCFGHDHPVQRRVEDRERERENARISPTRGRTACGGPTTFPTSEPNTSCAARRCGSARPARSGPNASRSASWSGTSTASTADCR